MLKEQRPHFQPPASLAAGRLLRAGCGDWGLQVGTRKERHLGRGVGWGDTRLRAGNTRGKWRRAPGGFSGAAGFRRKRKGNGP